MSCGHKFIIRVFSYAYPILPWLFPPWKQFSKSLSRHKFRKLRTYDAAKSTNCISRISRVLSPPKHDGFFAFLSGLWYVFV